MEVFEMTFCLQAHLISRVCFYTIADDAAEAPNNGALSPEERELKEHEWKEELSKVPVGLGTDPGLVVIFSQ